ncbi:MAG TPA: hypothetical protein P5235_08310, partial [Saprospiraceae bacterium]|nr:hypothetical protein [Saprospiraceae bacterium]
MLDAVPQYNGNISWAEWRVKGEQRHAYGFTYDSNDRLRKAKYATYDETCEMVEDDGYSVPLKDYDPLGNITMLQRKGLVKVLPPTTQNENPELIFDYIDKLSYNYSIGSNLLNNVTEGSNTQKGFKVSSSYGYD